MDCIADTMVQEDTSMTQGYKSNDDSDTIHFVPATFPKNVRESTIFCTSKCQKCRKMANMKIFNFVCFCVRWGSWTTGATLNSGARAEPQATPFGRRERNGSENLANDIFGEQLHLRDDLRLCKSINNPQSPIKNHFSPRALLFFSSNWSKKSNNFVFKKLQKQWTTTVYSVPVLCWHQKSPNGSCETCKCTDLHICHFSTFLAL